MRIWDISPEILCGRHLLGEHAELHAVWSVLTRGKSGFSRHPEVLRWKGKLKALYNRHRKLVEEMKRRGYRHRSPLDSRLAAGRAEQTELLDSRKEQVEILRAKRCGCGI